MTLRWRLALGLGLITALVIGFVGVGAYLAVADRLENSVDESLRERAAEVTKAYEDNREHEPRPGGQTAPTNPGAATQAAQSGDGDGDDSPFTRPTQCPPAGAMQPAAGAQVVDDDGTVTVCIEGGVELPVC